MAEVEVDGRGKRKQPTAKQAAFVQAYMACHNATEAYEQVYNVRQTMNRTTCARNAHELLDSDMVALCLKEAKERKEAELSKKTTKTLQQFVDDLEEAADLARQTGNATALTNARMAQAKLLGLVTDKSEARVTQVVTPAEQAPDLAQIWAKVSVNKPSH